MSELFIKEKFGYELNPEEAKRKFPVSDTFDITLNDLENILVTSLEGGIGYWARLDNTGSEWGDRPNDMPLSQYALSLLITGGSLKFEATDGEDDDSDWFLSCDKLLKGIALNIKDRSDSDLEDMDAETADCIIQYALFGEIIYG